MLKEKMTSRYLTAIRKLLKAYHKKFVCFGKPTKKERTTATLRKRSPTIAILP